ncbi:hypothetical protein [Coleofasciculus sp. G2-EDA-02]|uniref:hypothetical protein n=1 Tax=Coleofasciculus sp. G2-EDA-02 TaxID=3069529 RepID=UPI0032F29533
MNDYHQQLLTAFLNGLAKLEQPLPPKVQSKLHDLAQQMKANPHTIGNLDSIAADYPPLDTLYHQECNQLEQNVGVRNKGLPPLPIPNEATQELTNSAIDIFSAPDSVAKAKTKANPNLLQRIWQAIRGKN